MLKSKSQCIIYTLKLWKHQKGFDWAFSGIPVKYCIVGSSIIKSQDHRKRSSSKCTHNSHPLLVTFAQLSTQCDIYIYIYIADHISQAPVLLRVTEVSVVVLCCCVYQLYHCLYHFAHHQMRGPPHLRCHHLLPLDFEELRLKNNY